MEKQKQIPPKHGGTDSPQPAAPMPKIKSTLKSIPWLLALYRRAYFGVFNPLQIQLPAYGAGLLRRPQHVTARFLLVCSPRSGSELVGSLIERSPDIYWEGESFDRNALWPHLYVVGRSNLSPKACYGMKIFSEEILINGRFSPQKLFPQLQREGWKLISLQRHNRLRQAISRLKARERNVWRESSDESAPPRRKPRVRVDPVELIELLTMLDENAALQSRWLENVPHLALSYEDDLADGAWHQDTANRIFSHLGLRPAPTKADIVKQGSRRLADDIENPDEVIAALRDSPFAQYVDDLA